MVALLRTRRRRCVEHVLQRHDAAFAAAVRPVAAGEFGHAVQHHIVPDLGEEADWGAIGEGFSEVRSERRHRDQEDAGRAMGSSHSRVSKRHC